MGGGMIEWLDLLVEWSSDAVKHWSLAFFVGFLGFLLTSTILSVLRYVARGLSKRMGAGSIILICSLLVAFSLALASHWALDYFWRWWNTPLGPPLNLK
jgi:hypothetical protein